MLDMYKGQVNSPQVGMSVAINSTRTTIPLLEDGVFNNLEYPTLMVIGGDTDHPETVKALSYSTWTLTVQRGFEGTAQAWDVGTKVGRNFTAYDYNALVDNVNELEADKLDKASVVNNLTTTSTTSALSANQGKILNDGKVNKTDIVDNLSSTSGVVPLSANQGRVLFQYANDGKTNIAGVIGSPALSSNSFATLKNYIQNNKNTMASNLTAKGVSSVGTDTLANLASKIGNIETKTVASGTMSLTFGASSPSIDYDKSLGWQPSFVSYAMEYSYNNHTYIAMYDSYSGLLSLIETRTSDETRTYINMDLILSTGFNVDISFHFCDSTAQNNIKGKTVTVKYYAVK